MGQSTVFYAAPNTGKTLIILREICRQLAAGKLDPEKVFYVNADDNYRGLTDKQALAEEYGFKMLVPGMEGLELPHLALLMADQAKRGAEQYVVIIDTLKKFADIMDKRDSTRWGKVVREFVQGGGTVISLAHTNKHKDAEGRSVYAGTADALEDCDCAYTIDTVKREDDGVIVEFENLKQRGDVDFKRGFRYEPSLDYGLLFQSVSSLDVDEVAEAREEVQQQEAVDADQAIIFCVRAIIREGTNQRTELGREVAKLTEATQRRVIEVLDRYCGDDPERHHWRVERGERNAHRYFLLEQPAEAGVASGDDSADDDAA